MLPQSISTLTRGIQIPWAVKKNNHKSDLMQFFSADATIFLEEIKKIYLSMKT